MLYAGLILLLLFCALTFFSREKFKKYNTLLSCLVGVTVLMVTYLFYPDKPLFKTVILPGSIFVLVLSITRKFIFKDWIVVSLGLLFSSLFFFLSDQQIILNAFTIEPFYWPVFMLPVGIYLCLCGLDKLIGVKEEQFKIGLQMIMLSFFIYLSYFLANIYGVLLVFIGLTFYTIFTKKNQKVHHFLAALFLLLIFHNSLNLESIDLFLGDVLFAFLIGFIFQYIVPFFSLKSNNPLWINAFIITKIVGIILFLLYVGSQKSDLGGEDSLLAFLFGLIVGSIKEGVVSTGDRLPYLALGFSILLIPFFKMNEQIGTPIVPNVDSRTVKESLSYFSIDDISGVWTLDNQKSNIAFSLGPKGGQTKGLIKNFSASLDIDNKKITGTIESRSVTTKNRSRDKAIYDLEYLNCDVYPNMTYTGELITLSDSSFLFQGQFVMLGKKVEINLPFYVTAKTEKEIVLVGKSELNRVAFGMTPDSKEGNVVSFEYQFVFSKSKKD